MNTTTTDRVAIVTGGSRGIGRAVALELAGRGLPVVLAFAGNRAAAEATVDDITGAGGRALAVQADVADPDAVAEVFDTAERAFGGVDVVVHAAGRMVLSPIADLDLDAFDDLHRTNVRGTFVVAKQAARRTRPGGSLVTFSTSVLGLRFPTYGAYAASKAAVEALTLILARELRGRDVTVNAVAPGPTATELFLDGKDEETVAGLARQAPLERLGTPEDIAAVVAFLSSPEGHWINGQVVRANGGIV
ncbi:oxidoreductase, short-chain dehydrogenase/reductase family [Actinokineospora spheciospongiae]|uniref:Oxidoreductase, short-chain dehydrogenase/reductase family n=1 Tax=Actinokineospora spheciospongiae TaxID=909613 RepID=W7IQB9_9PSEU|nr:SDR family oxidoreductase [Actinokineospora spheciospongiae]EWC58962.1 oxidoreductase, short-chain dehydrogenase/reductase family [Actinokineospora spheciospongiae]